jgi:hypothetical protein
MKLETKTQIARSTLSLLTVVVFLFLLGLLVCVLCAGLDINPFKETTTSFLVAAFMGLIGVAVVLVFLNVATAISLIADAKIAELKINPGPGSLKKWSIVFFGTAIVVVGIIFGGTFLSKDRYLNVVQTQADEVLQANDNLLAEVSRLLSSGQPGDFKRIFEIRDFLAHQRSGLPQLTLIYSGKFGDKLALYSINGYFSGDIEKKTYNPSYFECTRTLDCDYLTRFFSGEKVEVLRKYTLRDNQFYIYIPHTGKEARFVLLFDSRNEYGKLGS